MIVLGIESSCDEMAAAVVRATANHDATVRAQVKENAEITATSSSTIAINADHNDDLDLAPLVTEGVINAAFALAFPSGGAIATANNRHSSHELGGASFATEHPPPRSSSLSASSESSAPVKGTPSAWNPGGSGSGSGSASSAGPAVSRKCW